MAFLAGRDGVVGKAKTLHLGSFCLCPLKGFFQKEICIPTFSRTAENPQYLQYVLLRA
jgi:hypothetical protein